jgi:hypothetical protein
LVGLQEQVRKAQEIASEVNLRAQVFSTGKLQLCYCLIFLDYKSIKDRLQQANLNKGITTNRYSLTEGFDDLTKVHNYQLALLRDHDEATKSVMAYCVSSKV